MQVSQLVLGSREGDAREMSGEVCCPLEGRRVGVSVLRTLRSLLPITWLRRVPLASWIEECQRGS